MGWVYALPALLEVPVFLGVRAMAHRLRGRRPFLLWSTAIYALLAVLLALLGRPLGFSPYLDAGTAWPFSFFGDWCVNRLRLKKRFAGSRPS